MFTAIFALLMIPFVLLFSLGIPIIVGVVVYRDANKRVDCNPWLWALIAALVPSFIGVVIYVIVRRDYPLKPENRMQAEETDDDSTYYQRNYDDVAVENRGTQGGFPTWLKVIIIIVAALLILWLAGIVVATMRYLFGYMPVMY